MQLDESKHWGSVEMCKMTEQAPAAPYLNLQQNETKL